MAGSSFSCRPRRVIVYLVCVVQLVNIGQTQAREFLLGVMFHNSSSAPPNGWSYQRVAPAVSIALENFRAAGGFLNDTFRIVWIGEGCDAKKIMNHVIPWYYDLNVDAIIGSVCSRTLTNPGYYFAAWNLPWFPYGAFDPLLSNKDDFSTLVRVTPPDDKMGAAMVALFRYHKWERAVLISTSGLCSYGANGITLMFRKENIYLSDNIYAEPDPDAEAMDHYLDSVQTRSRVVIICFRNTAMVKFIQRARERGMTSPDYVFIYYRLIPDEFVLRPWTFGVDGNLTEAEWHERRQTFLAFKSVTMAGLTGPHLEEFYDQIPIKLLEPPWNTNISIVNNYRGSIQSLLLHDAVTLYLNILNETLHTDASLYKDGRHFFNSALNMSFTGMSGRVHIDDNGDRDPNLWLWSTSPGDHVFRPALQADIPEGHVFPVGQIYWGTPDNRPPTDTPACGFFDELCPEDNTARNAILIGSCSGVFLLLVCLGTCFIFYRRRKEEEALQNMMWKVRFDDIDMMKARAGSVVGLSMKSLHSVHSRTSGGQSEGERAHDSQIFTQVGMYKGNMVAVKKVTKTTVTMTRDDLLELKEMRDMSHDNINAFIGACIDPPNVCYLMQYCPKGSVEDILENDAISLDWMFKSSLISDLSNGMGYLHRSKLNSHGNLKSGVCLVDSRWVLKISSYGLHAFRGKDKSANEVGEYERYRDLLWTAPELLRMADNPRYGTQKGDVYSFGVLLQEIVYRTMPYFMDIVSPKELIDSIKEVRNPPFRPPLPKITDDVIPEILDLIKECWEENPLARPDFEGIKKHLGRINKGKKVNILDNMISRMEAYANNLEEIVGQRTGELTEEKKKTDTLLYRMLPSVVAEKLKQGKTVEAEMFDAVTIYFSDIVGFTSLSSTSTPMQVVDLLNDLYTLFDGILDQHDVYKVETIGDAYMVASGLPKLNGDNHVAEIANMALDLLSALMLEFRIRHRPELRMQLRCGFHTGPCAAGVVGLRMPRYCLFGETVNIASRMESGGVAQKIQVSEEAHKALSKLPGYDLITRGPMEAQGQKSETTYFLRGREGYLKELPPWTN